mgnify:CR=1 FL=1
MFDPRNLCTSAPFYRPWLHAAAGLLMRAPVPAGLAIRLPILPRLEKAEALPVSNAHFVLLENDDPQTLVAFMTAWEQGPPHRSLAFWIPRRFTEKPAELTAARLLNGLRVPDDPELVAGWLTDHLHRPATWAELRAVLDFFQGASVDENVLGSADVARFLSDHGGREAARAHFFRLQHQCLQALLGHHRDALAEKNLVVVVFDRRESLLADRTGRRQWIQVAQAMGSGVVPVTPRTESDPPRRIFTVHPALGQPREADGPAWIRDADEAWRRVHPRP